MIAYAITDIGKRRKLNQDYTYMSLEQVGRLPNLFIVCDGMGGHRGGGYASRLAVETMMAQLLAKKETGSASDALVDAIQQANSVIRQTAGEDAQLSGMGTTVVAAVCVDDRLEVANVGDSRLYLVREEQIRQITQDHSLVEEMVRLGGLSREQARRHPDKNIITRAVGAEEKLEVDCFVVPLQAGDKVLLCSDGLTNMLEDEEICKILNRDESVEKRAQALVKAANDNGGRDNIAVIILEPFSEEVSR